MERALFIFWGAWLFLNLIAAFRVFAYLVARRGQDKRWRTTPDQQKSAVVIIPVKGFDLQSTPRFFNTMFAQEYGSYRVIVAFESWDDPVAEWLSDEFEVSEDSPSWKHPQEDSPLREVVLACAGPAKNEGQKVCNQRAAFAHLNAEDEVIVFADSDISLGNDWLARLTAPINCGAHPLSTTYRWLIPRRPTLPSQLASVINGSITTQGGWEMSNVLWGGSMAMDRSVFDELRVPRLIEGSLNDDLRISKEARRAGNRIAFVRSLVLPTRIDFTWRSFFEFARRQYTQVKVFSPILYLGANVLLAFYALGIASVIAALIQGYFLAWIPLAATYVIDQFRGLARQQVYLSLFESEAIRRKLFATCWLEQMLTPFWMVLHWLIVVSTWTQDRIEWAGIRYQIISKSKTRILGRSRKAESLPVSVPGLALLSSLHDRRRTASVAPARTATPTEPVVPVTATAHEPTPVETTPAPDEIAISTSDETGVGESVSPANSETPPADAPVSDTSPPAPLDSAPAAPAPKLAHPGVSSRVTALSERPPIRRKRFGVGAARSGRAKARDRRSPERFPVHPRHRRPARHVTRSVESSTAPVPHSVAPRRKAPSLRDARRRPLSAAAAKLASHTWLDAHLAGLNGAREGGSAAPATARRSPLTKPVTPHPRFPVRSTSPPPSPTGGSTPSTDRARHSPTPTRANSAHSASRRAVAPRGLRPGERGARPGASTAGRANLPTPRRRGQGRNRPVARGAGGRTV